MAPRRFRWFLRAALLTGAVLAPAWLALSWLGRYWEPWSERPMRDVTESAAAARALAGCYEGQISKEVHPWWVPLSMVALAPDSREGRSIYRLDAEPEPASPEARRSPHWIPTYLVRDYKTGASAADHNWWAPVSGGGFLVGIRNWADYEDGVVHPTGRLRDGAAEFSGRWSRGEGYRHKLVMYRVPCPRLPA
jgi:hypothetical protein